MKSRGPAAPENPEEISTTVWNNMKCLCCTATTGQQLKYKEKLCTKKDEIINRQEKLPGPSGCGTDSLPTQTALQLLKLWKDTEKSTDKEE